MASLTTRSGTIPFPFYAPVTTFGDKYPLDKLIRPYLKRLAHCALVSYHYAKPLSTNPLGIPLLVDSGGFASLFDCATVEERKGLGIISIAQPDGSTEEITPQVVLDLQTQIADVAFTLDFPIPPSMAATALAVQRQDLTIANAFWALENRRRKDLPLYACIQAWDVHSAVYCCDAYSKGKFDGIAIGGLVPRSQNKDLVFEIVKAVRQRTELPLHVFGLGHPNIVDELYSIGVNSVDSSSYIKYAVEGKLWSDSGFKLEDPSPAELMQLALCNLATATGKTLPFSVREPMFSCLK
jgi:helicase